MLNENIDLLLVNLVDTKHSQQVIDIIKQTNIPVIFFNREPYTTNAIKSYKKSIYIGTDAKEAGDLEGDLLLKAWNSSKLNVDKNKDNVLQYIMLQGELYNIEAIFRTKYSVEAINKANVKTNELALFVCNWDQELAEKSIKSIFLKYGSNIEAIISNNDAMAIGAVNALQKYGYNKGNPQKTITVVGIDAIPEAENFIDNNFMTGSVVQDHYGMAEALYLSGLNLINGKSAIDGTQYKFDDTGVSIRIPHKGFIDNL